MADSSLSLQQIQAELKADAQALSKQVNGVLLKPPYNEEPYLSQSAAFAHRAVDVVSAVNRGRRHQFEEIGISEVEIAQEMLGFLKRAKEKLSKNIAQHGWGGEDSLEGYDPTKLETLLDASVAKCEAFINQKGGPNQQRSFKMKLELLFGGNSDFEHGIADVYTAVSDDKDIDGTGYDIARPIVMPLNRELNQLVENIMPHQLTPERVAGAIRGIKTTMRQSAKEAGLLTEQKNLIKPLMDVIERAEEICRSTSVEMKSSLAK